MSAAAPAWGPPGPLRLALLLLLSGSAAASARKCPNVMLLLDAETAMGQQVPGPAPVVTRWQLQREGLMHVLSAYCDKVHLGLELYSSAQVGALACYSAARIDALPADGCSSAGPTFAQKSPGGQNNAGDAVRRAASEGRLDDATRDNFIVLVTTGNANCNPADQPDGQYTVAQLAAAAALPVPVLTYVLSIGLNQAPTLLTQMAQAGGAPVPNCDPDPSKHRPCYYDGSSRLSFLVALDRVFAQLPGLATCDDSCFGGGCPASQICKYPAPGLLPTCVADPCAPLACDQGSYCSDGKCTQVCPPCPVGTYCVSGRCKIDQCAGKVWDPSIQFCDPVRAGVQPNRCAGSTRSCPPPGGCDPATGMCADDPCHYVRCPPGSSCNRGGWCQKDGPLPDAAPADLEGEAGDGAAGPVHGNRGCSCAAGGAAERGPLPLWLLALAAAVGGRPWRRRGDPRRLRR